MHRFFFTFLLTLLLYPTTARAFSKEIESLNLSQLENRLHAIDSELDRLAEYSLRTGVGSVGYRSNTHFKENDQEWIQIDFKQEVFIDQVVLVPTIWRDQIDGLRADGFPLDFQIFAGTKENHKGEMLASFVADDATLPRIAPLVITLPRTRASWVRLEARVLSPRIWDGQYVLQLSELLVFNGQNNVALHQTVTTSSPQSLQTNARDKRYLVDGFVPYLMATSQGKKSVAFNTNPGLDDHPSLTIDLETEQIVDHIHLHAPDLSDTIPQALLDDHGIARTWLIEGASQADFSDAKHLYEFKLKSVYDVGPIIMFAFPPTTCRYIRLTAVDPFIGYDGKTRGPQIALAEIEVFSNGLNVALGKKTSASFTNFPNDRPLAALTDGRNFYGQILPIRDWLDQLSLRHDLERERPRLAAEIQRRYDRQKTNLRRMFWLVGILVVGIAFFILIDRMLRMREISGIRERFAADLHDELGANIHTIGLLGDVALNSLDNPERLKTVLERNRRLTDSTGTAVRHCINLQEAKGLYGSLPDDMERTARRILSKIDYSIEIHGKEILSNLKPKERTDLLLFYKECLVNTSRHSDATNCLTSLVAGEKEIILTVRDNGRGIPNKLAIESPNSLKRRAKLLGANTTTECPPEGGTLIRLSYRPRKFKLFRK